MPKTPEDDDQPLPAWTKWYLTARNEMAFRYGRRGIPIDRYREQWGLGATPQEAAKHMDARLMNEGK